MPTKKLSGGAMPSFSAICEMRCQSADAVSFFNSRPLNSVSAGNLRKMAASAAVNETPLHVPGLRVVRGQNFGNRHRLVKFGRSFPLRSRHSLINLNLRNQRFPDLAIIVRFDMVEKPEPEPGNKKGDENG